MPSIFISYRRADTTSGYASWIYERIEKEVGAGNVFMDIDSLPLGVDFVEYLKRVLARTDLAFVLIGPGWLDAADESGGRRLDNPEDLVRFEVAEALRLSLRVVPILVDGAQMPESDLLPDELRPLARRHALTFHRQGGAAIRDLLAAVRQVERELERSEREGRQEGAAARRRDRATVEEASGLIPGVKGPVDAEQSQDISTRPSAPQNHERDPAGSTVEGAPTAVAPTQHQTTRPKHPSKEVTPSRRPSLRLWVMGICGLALGAALAAFLIAGTGPDHTSSTSSAGSSASHASTRWITLTHLPSRVMAAGVAAYDGQVWVVGGSRNSSHDPVTDVYAYDPRGGHWRGTDERVPQLQVPVAHAAVVAAQGTLYVIGGYTGCCGSDSHHAVSTVWRLDSPTGRWHIDEQAALPDPREAGAAAFDGTRIVFGGGNAGSVKNPPAKGEVWELNLKRGGGWTQLKGTLSPPRDHLATASNQRGTVWFIGGSDRESSNVRDGRRGQGRFGDPQTACRCRRARGRYWRWAGVLHNWRSHPV